MIWANRTRCELRASSRSKSSTSGPSGSLKHTTSLTPTQFLTIFVHKIGKKILKTFSVEKSYLKTGGKVAGFRAGSGVSKFGLISDN